MDIIELGAIGELVGGVAVIGSLVFVGLQIWHGTEETRRSHAIERARTNREVSKEGAEIFMATSDSEILDIFRRALVDFSTLSNGEKAMLHNRFLSPMTLHCLSTFLAAQDDLLDESYAERWTNYFAMLVKSPGTGAWWDRLKADFHPGFAEAVDRVRHDPSGPPPYHDSAPWFAPDERPEEI